MGSVAYCVPVIEKDEDVLIDIAEAKGYEYSVGVLNLIDDLIQELIFKTTMKEELKMLEDTIEQLIGALEANTAAILRADLSADDVKKQDSPAPKPVSKKKSSKKTSRNTKPSVTVEQVKAELVKIDKESAKAVLKSFDVAKLTDLKPENFEDAIKEAQAYMVDETPAGDDFLD